MGGERYSDLDIAIVGMACRFPGARDVREFWANLQNGVESIRFLTEDELVARGVDRAVIRDPRFVAAEPAFDDIDCFDADFFGYSPHEASLLDPQHRLFLECAWHALEDAGHSPARPDEVVGVFAGSSLSGYLLFNLLQNDRIDSRDDALDLMTANDKDFLATRVAYKLNLKGPSVAVQTGCSTSLVACHLACQALLSYQCDLALAGGVSVHVPQRAGYYYEPAGITSPDGHCRPFDAAAAGTLFGGGVGIVALSRLDDALARRDQIYAIIRGTAVGNDGSAKLGYTAPSAEGQAAVISAAQAIANVHPSTISYVETHGTGTPLGDPIEIAALTTAFGRHAVARQVCGLGAVKSNIGHLDAAAGVAGLIKTALALQHGQLPPTVNFEKPNPRIDFASTPFFVQSTLTEWNGPLPRRAGVSSFGIGGTNAHAVLEEAPVRPPGRPARSRELFVLSAASEDALEQLTNRVADVFADGTTALCDISYTLLAGRRGLPYRRAFVCSSHQEGHRILSERDAEHLGTSRCQSDQRTVAFLFPGGGAQHMAMARDLYVEEKVFRDWIDRCVVICRDECGLDLLPVLSPADASSNTAPIPNPGLALPALLAVEYSLAQLWMSWGVLPSALVGHSLGQYTAACLAGTFSLESGLRVVAMRGRLFERLAPGAMLTVELDEDGLRDALGPEMSIAALNAPKNSVLSGAVQVIDWAEAQLRARGVTCHRVAIDVAAHSPAVDAILPEFETFMRTIPMASPSMPVISNVSGTWMTSDEACDPAYWARHLRNTVRFSDGLATLFAHDDSALLEVGPGTTMSSLARLHPAAGGRTIVSSLRHPTQPGSDVHTILQAAAKLWLSGCRIDAEGFSKAGAPNRVSLPGYPFARESHWISPSSTHLVTSPRRAGKVHDPGKWAYVPSWRSTPLPLSTAAQRRQWLVIRDAIGIAKAFVDLAVARGDSVIEAAANLDGDDACAAVARRCREQADSDITIADFAMVGKKVDAADLIPLARLACAFGNAGIKTRLSVIMSNAQRIETTDVVDPENSMVAGILLALAQEHQTVTTQLVDICSVDSPQSVADVVMRELLCDPRHKMVAWRGRLRWVRAFEPLHLEREACRAAEPGAPGYLITGGLGTVGLTIASGLVATRDARIILTTRTPFPSPESWDCCLRTLPSHDRTRVRIEELRRIDPDGTHITVRQADVADEAAMRGVVASTRSWGGLAGVVHLAGLTGLQAFRLMADVGLSDIAESWRSKVEGAKVLRTALAEQPPRVVVLFSSTASVLGGIGLGLYAAANCFLDAIAVEQAALGQRWISAGWDAWPNAPTVAERASGPRTSIDQFQMTAPEAMGMFDSLVNAAPAGHVVVSTGELEPRLALWIDGQQPQRPRTKPASRARAVEIAGSRTLTEEVVTRVWEELLGIERPGLAENFFELGGNSLIGLKVVSRLRAEAGIPLAVTSLFEAPTIRALARLVDGNGAMPIDQVHRSRGERRLEARQAARR